MLGGNGKPDNYAQAWENCLNAWDGFPTATVIGGFDFVSEHGSQDYNPIECNEDIIDNVDGSFCETGVGAAVASMILEQAPQAKLYSYKTVGHTSWGRVYIDHRDYTYRHWKCR